MSRPPETTNSCSHLSPQSYKQERQRGTQRNGVRRAAEPPMMSEPESTQSPRMTRRPSAQGAQVASIREDEEGSPTASAARKRGATVVATASPAVSARVRTQSVGAGSAAAPPQQSVTAPPTPAPRPRGLPKGMDGSGQAGMPQRRRGVARNRESLDLDDIMNGSDGEDDGEEAEATPDIAPPSTPGRGGQRVLNGAPQPPRVPAPGVSRTTRDLMDFLEQGPPQLDAPLPAAPSPIREPSSAKGGRFRNIVSRLARGVSQEQLRGRAQADALAFRGAPPSPAGRAVAGNTVVYAYKPPRPPRPPAPPPPSSFEPPLPDTESARSVRTRVDSVRSPSLNGVAASVTSEDIKSSTGSRRGTPNGSTPTLPISPPASPSTASLTDERAPVPSLQVLAPAPVLASPQVPTPPGTTPTRRLSIQRKAVPVFTDGSASTSPSGAVPPTSPPALSPTSPSANQLHTPEPSELERVRPLRPVRLRSSPSQTPTPIAEHPPPGLNIRLAREDSQSVRSAAPSPVSASAPRSSPRPAASPRATPSPQPSMQSIRPRAPADLEAPPPAAAEVPAPRRSPLPAPPTQMSKNAPPSVDDLVDLRRLMARATTADECRLLLDMCLLRAGAPLFSHAADFTVPAASPGTGEGNSRTAPVPTAPAVPPTPTRAEVEPSVVEMLLSPGAYGEHGAASDTMPRIARSISMCDPLDAAQSKSPRREVFVQ
jgi:hypothetical protein